MSFYLGGEFALLCGAKNLALNGNTNLQVTTLPLKWESIPELLWTFVPLFDNACRYKGLGIRNVGNGKYIRGQPDMPVGGGVGLVNEAQVDEWAGWGLGTPRPGHVEAYVPLILNACTTAISVMTLAGSSGWGPGTQVITYEWAAGDAQTWEPLFKTRPRPR